MPYADREIQLAYQKDHYRKNKGTYTEAARRSQKAARQRLQKVIYGYLLEHPCVDCGEVDPIVLEFDHIREKEFNISHATRTAMSVKKLMTEISKCEVRCANCHRRKTARNQDWKKSHPSSKSSIVTL